MSHKSMLIRKTVVLAVLATFMVVGGCWLNTPAHAQGIRQKTYDSEIQNAPDNRPRATVADANTAEMALYEAPTSDETASNYRQYVVVPSPAHDAVMSLVQKLIDSGDAAAEKPKHTIDEIVEETISPDGKTAKVVTKETSLINFKLRKPFKQTARLHTYELIHDGVRWKVLREIF